MFKVRGEVTIQIDAKVDEATDDDARERFKDEVEDAFDGLTVDENENCKLEVVGLQIRVMRIRNEEE